jgi:hypothetical protein
MRARLWIDGGACGGYPVPSRKNPMRFLAPFFLVFGDYILLGEKPQQSNRNQLPNVLSFNYLVSS